MSPPRRDRKSGGACQLRVGVYLDSSQIGGAEASLARTLGGLAGELSVKIVGTDEAVVRWLAARVGAEAAEVIPAVAGKGDLVGILRHCAVVGRGVDVVHVNLWHPWASHYGLLAAWLKRVPTVVVLHADLEVHSRLSAAVSRWFFERASAVVAVSAEMARSLEERAGLAPGSVLTVYNGVEAGSAIADREPGGAITVCCAGRLSHEKGFDVALRALAELEGVFLHLVGDGPDRKALEELAAELGLEGRVRFEGWVQDVRPALERCDVFVAPSRREAFGMAVAEAMAAGLPVVASAVGGLPELVVHGETGLLVPPDDPRALAGAVCTLVKDPASARRMGRAGRERVLRHFGAEASRAAMLDIYRAAAAGRKPSGRGQGA